jgi:hypothetical protein
MLDLRERGEIDDSVWNSIERDLDLEDLRMDALPVRSSPTLTGTGTFAMKACGSTYEVLF